MAKVDPQAQVSSESEELILVNEKDEITGYLSKAEAHDGLGVLHRAFSVFLFNPEGELLLQRRSEGKRLWPGYWSNSCCSHPRRGEEMLPAVRRRIFEELGVNAQPQFVYKFRYQRRFEDIGSENELCWVFVCVTSEKVSVNIREVQDWKYLPPASVQLAVSKSPEDYTPWMKMEWDMLTTEFLPLLPQTTQAGLRG